MKTPWELNCMFLLGVVCKITGYVLHDLLYFVSGFVLTIGAWFLRYIEWGEK